MKSGVVDRSSGRPSASEKHARYEVHDEIASGGMARVHFGRLLGDEGFTRVVAVKKMHTRLAEDPRFVTMFLDEARVASRIRHPNVVTTLDVVSEDREVLIVMEYVRGLPLSTLLTRAGERSEPLSVSIVASIAVGLLAGLHAAHEARGPNGDALGIVHRDVSPQNVLVDVDGVARVMDFGIAKAKTQMHVTVEGELKGKLSYMAPEQILTFEIDRRADVFSAGVVVWSMLAGRKLFAGKGLDDLSDQILRKPIPLLATLRADVPEALDKAVAKALSRKADDRFATAREFLAAIEEACPRLATQREIGLWVEKLGGDIVAKRDLDVARIEGATTEVDPPPKTDNAQLNPAFDETGTDAPTVELSGSESPSPIEDAATTEPASLHAEPTVREPRQNNPVKEASIERVSEPTLVPVTELSRPPPPRSFMLIAVATSVAVLVGGGAFGALMLFGKHDVPDESRSAPVATETAATLATSITSPSAASSASAPIELASPPPSSSIADSARPAPPPAATSAVASNAGSHAKVGSAKPGRPVDKAAPARPVIAPSTPPGYFPAKP